MSKALPISIYHNNSCSKSRSVLELLTKEQANVDIVHYLDHPLNKEELTGILQILQLKPLELIRTKEPLFQEKFAGKVLSDEEWIDVLLSYPILMERPIIIKGNKGVIARPTQRIYDILEQGD
ncbi:ArsC/Spx/MgsR family protein [Sphingobacterium faecale]|uniref:Arsenate reductase (Glutaredoxin) n=1 Tax=Sphingobacterium faecale TaxID=2803775 RepID=A0ABS1R5D4_9SPHI|nr:ArsC/Spx/MgsR family protein [Sphingobacterium faecale]MBL1409910.1 arsenate reductase (glutaredoxin) [Sphingobacterium faecale]